MPLFSGFASAVTSKKVYDVELIKQDLLNRINTRKGERIMDPEFGSIIWDLLFELKSEFVTSEIQRDLISIINSEPRVSLQNIDLVEQENGYIANIVLLFVHLNTIDELKVSFNRQISENTGVS